MSSYNLPVIALLVFVAVLLLLQAVAILWRSHRGAAALRLQRRLDLRAQFSSGDGQNPLLKQNRLSALASMAHLLGGLSFAVRLERLIAQAGLSWTVSSLILTSAAAGVAGLLFAIFMAFPPLGGLALALALALLPWAIVLHVRRRRLRKLEQQLPEALDLISRAMRAGHSLLLGIQMLSEEMPEPVSGEFRSIHEQVSFGMSLQQALANLCKRVPLTDYRYFVVSVLIQRQSGGNLTEVLGNLSRLVRGRLKLRGRVRVLSAEGRMSAWTLAVMPFALGALLYAFNPTFISPLWTDPIGIAIAESLLVMMVLGILVLIWIVKIRI